MTVQIAFSMVLLVLAGLFTQSLANVARVDLGLEADAVATFAISPALSGYSPERSAALFRQIEDDLEALILQAGPRGLMKQSLTVLTTGETAMHKLGRQMAERRKELKREL